MKLSLCTLGLTDRPLGECIRLAAEIGYQGIEPLAREPHLPPTTSEEQVQRIAGELQATGLAVPCLAASVGGFSQLDVAGSQSQLDVLRRLLEIAVGLGCPLVRVCAGGPEPAQAEPEHWRRAAEGLQQAAEIAASYGVRLGLETHYNYLHQDVAGVCNLLDLAGRAEIGVIYDPANLYVAGAEHGPAVVHRLRQHILHVHVKDSLRADAPGPDVMGPAPYLYRPRPMGEGGVSYAPIVSALREIGYTGFLSVESRWPSVDGAEVARQEYAALQTFLNKEEA